MISVSDDLLPEITYWEIVLCIIISVLLFVRYGYFLCYQSRNKGKWHVKNSSPMVSPLISSALTISSLGGKSCPSLNMFDSRGHIFISKTWGTGLCVSLIQGICWKYWDSYHFFSYFDPLRPTMIDAPSVLSHSINLKGKGFDLI